MDVERHRERIRRLVTEAPDEPTYCEFKQKLSYSTKREKGELVKDVAAFANTDLESLGGYGYLVFGVSNDGRVVGVEGLAGDPPSETRQIVNGRLDRPIVFEYLTCEVEVKVGCTKRIAAIVVPDSSRRPHVVSREIKEHTGNKDVYWLRKSEVWVRGTGGRHLATAEDLDTIYEGKLRRLVDDQVRPLRERIERLEEDLREHKSVLPQLGFGLVMNGAQPSLEGRPYPVLDNLVSVGGVHKEIDWAKAKYAAVKGKEARQFGSRHLGPSSIDYADYIRSLESWLQKLKELLVVDLVLTNMGRVPAQDVQVVLDVPADLRPREVLPSRPQRPRDFVLSSRTQPASRGVLSKQTSPDSLIGPKIYDTTGLGIAQAVWEVGKLYHDRPLFTRSNADEVGGLLISSEDYCERLSQVGGEVHLKYAVRAANVPETESGVLILR
jgi:Putative DNA-binding domain